MLRRSLVLLAVLGSALAHAGHYQITYVTGSSIYWTSTNESGTTVNGTIKDSALAVTTGGVGPSGGPSSPGPIFIGSPSPGAASAQGSMVAHFQWVQDNPNDQPPAAITIQENLSAHWDSASANSTGTASISMPSSTSSSPGSVTVSGTRVRTISPTGYAFDLAGVTANATVTAPNSHIPYYTDWGECVVSYSVTVQSMTYSP